MPDSLHRNTPSLAVIDSRGLLVRQVDLYRTAAGASAEVRVQAQQYDVPGRAVASWDARLFALREQQPTTRANLSATHSLSGTVLGGDSVDAGGSIQLFAESGIPLESWDTRGTHWQTDYDELLRPTALHEQASDQAVRTGERLSYADVSVESARHNLCGQMIRCDDGAGTHHVRECSMLGAVLRETRHLLSALVLPDWPPEASKRDALLEDGAGATSDFHYDATGTASGLTDARGNRQGQHVGVSGQLTQVVLKQTDAEEQVLLQDIRYNAFGQVESQLAGNGVLSLYSYDAADGRLLSLSTYRAANDPLQLLAYAYDPVGNVTGISDEAQPTRHFSNQRIEPTNHYAYDSLYQLIEASGREAASAAIRPGLPELAKLPVDHSQLLNYTQRYSYDSAGNLLQLKHEGHASYTRTMQVDPTSNRAVAHEEGEPPADFAAAFDASGNQRTLTPGQTLLWDTRNQLLRVSAVTRAEGDDDAERYAYDAGGHRLRKTATALTRAGVHSREVRYLPGLELRSDSVNDEQLEVIVVQAGRCAVRCLHWVSGRPADIANDQLRYSADDHLGSSTLELDADARLISHEGYYPFGGTAWWAARSEIEGKYKVVRYSGKERDASGLYYYGQRYYAPWLQRWISADPGGAVDGLNLYRMVGNSPIGHVDPNGQQSEPFELTEILVGAGFAIIAIVLFRMLLARRLHDGMTAILQEQTAAKELSGKRSSAHEDLTEQHELAEAEQHDLEQFLAGSSNPKYIQVERFAEIAYAFDLQTNQQRKHFWNNRHQDWFLESATKRGIRHQKLGEAVASPRIRRNALTPEKKHTDPVKLFNKNFEASATTRTQRNPQEKNLPPSSPSTSSRAYTAGVTPAAAQDANRVDIGDFFETKAFTNKIPRKDRPEMMNIITLLLDRFRQFNQGKAHPLRDGSLSLDIPSSGSGRGAQRLLLRRNEAGAWTPYRMGDTHRQK